MCDSGLLSLLLCTIIPVAIISCT